MESKITKGPTKLLFTANILQKYKVKYYECLETGFIQTEEPYWLDEAYSSAITAMDIGLLKRNFHLSELLERFISKHFKNSSQFLDYAGGFGTLCRLMRDKGFDFFHHDYFCQNLFANHFEADIKSLNAKFDMVTAVEFIEHTADPLQEIKKLFEYADTLFITTELQPDLVDIQKWHYFSFETGQHISFFNKKSLQKIAEILDVHLYSDWKQYHILSKKDFSEDPIKSFQVPYWAYKLKKISRKMMVDQNFHPRDLFGEDARMIKEKLDIG